jgi:glycosyltransferase involved in cell wall biosynthesis
MKILYSTLALIDKCDAPAYHVTGFCNALINLGHSVDLIYPSPGSNFKPELLPAVKRYPVHCYKFRGWSHLLKIWYWWQLRLLPLKKYDMIYLRLPPYSHLFSLLVRAQVPLVFELNGQEIMENPGFKKWARYFSLVTTDSEETIKLASQCWGIPTERFTFNQNAGIDAHIFNQKSDKKVPEIEGLLDRGLFRICHVSSFRTHHDFDTIIAAIKGLDFPYRIFFFGDGPERASVELKCQENHVNAVFPGAYPLKTLALILQNCDVCINAFKQWSQKVGNFRAFKLYEYMASGIPTIETYDPSLPVIYWAKDYLGIVPFENAPTMLHLIEDVHQHPHEWRIKAEEAQKWVFKNRTWKYIARNMVESFNKTKADK